MKTLEQRENLGGAPARPGLFHNADFIKLWAGETVSDFGSRMGGVAISFAAVISLRATPFQMGLLSAARTLPGLVLNLIAGAWVDRMRRRPILIATDLGRTAVLATVPIAALTGALRMPQLYAVILAAGVLGTFFDVAYRSYLPMLIARDELIDANSKLSASSAVAEVAGFGLSGWIVQWLTAPIAILVDAISFLASAAAIGAIRTREPPSIARSHRSGIAREVADGARALFAEPRLRAIAIASIVGGFASSLISAMYMLYVVDDLGFNPGALGMIFATGGASSLVGALAARRTSEAIGTGRAMVAGLAIEGLALMLLVLARGPTIESVALLVAQQLVGDGAATVYIINSTSLIQTIAPARMLGRVNGGVRFLGVASFLAGSIVAGVAGGVIGVRATIALGCVGLWIAAAMIARSAIWSIGGQLAEPAAQASAGVADE